MEQKRAFFRIGAKKESFLGILYRVFFLGLEQKNLQKESIFKTVPSKVTKRILFNKIFTVSIYRLYPQCHPGYAT